MNRAWNKTYGIDPAISIDDRDGKAVEEKFFAFADDRPGKKTKSCIHPPLWIQIVPMLPAVVVSVGLVLATRALGWPAWTVFALPLLASACGMALVNAWIMRRHFGPLFRRELALRGYDICLGCGYWLRGLGDRPGKCPECGKPVIPNPVSDRPAP